MFVCIVCYATPRRCFASRAPNFQGFIYNPTVGSSQFYYFIKFTPQLTFLRTIKLPFITYNCLQCYVNNYVQLLTSCVFSLIVPNDITQGQGVTTTASITVAISRVGFQEAIKILTGTTKYEGTDGYFWTIFLILLS